MDVQTLFLLPGGDTAVAEARRHVRFVGLGWCPQLLECALLATSEIVTNAVLHGGDQVSLVVRTTAETIRVEVYDNGHTLFGPPLASDGRVADAGTAAGVHAHDELSVGGRGLHIVDVLSQRWGVIQAQQLPGKAVWFEISPTS